MAHKSQTYYSMGITITAGGTTYNIPDPTELSYNLSDISQSDAGRDEQGVMHPMKLVDGNGHLVLKRQYTMGWAGATPDECAVILTACSQTETFMLHIIDPMTNAYDDIEVYVGDRQAPFQQWRNGQDGHLYQKVSYTLIEV